MNTIFLSYAKEDRGQVQDVYKALRTADLQPWMDTPPPPYALDGISPGADWDLTIRQKLKDARVTITFISHVSIAKEGYVQREYRLALSALAEKPADKVSVIPVLLDDCTPPDIRVDTISLMQLQWYRMYADGIQPLIDYLKSLFGPKNAPQESKNTEYLELLMEVNDARLDHNWMRKQIEKLQQEKDELRRGLDTAFIEREAERSRWHANLKDEQFRHR